MVQHMKKSNHSPFVAKAGTKLTTNEAWAALSQEEKLEFMFQNGFVDTRNDIPVPKEIYVDLSGLTLNIGR
jgi:hypothetical protein